MRYIKNVVSVVGITLFLTGHTSMETCLSPPRQTKKKPICLAVSFLLRIFAVTIKHKA